MYSIQNITLSYTVYSSHHSQPVTLGEQQRAAHFRSMSPPSTLPPVQPPQTGLGILMGNGNGTTNTNSTSVDQHSRIQADLQERDLQASALAAAGMVAVGLQAPPPLVGLPPPASPSNTQLVQGVDYSSTTNVQVHDPLLDDMDLDFANMFDPESEKDFVSLYFTLLFVYSLLCKYRSTHHYHVILTSNGLSLVPSYLQCHYYILSLYHINSDESRCFDEFKQLGYRSW